MHALFLVLLFVLGACFGSFLCCQARRLHLRQQDREEHAGKKSSRVKRRVTAVKPKSKAPKGSDLGSRSICFTCGQKIKWYDNIPLVSWFILRGRCRSCGQKIGWLEPAAEIGLAFAFLLPGLTFDFVGATVTSWCLFALSLLLICFLGFLAIYDAAYGELPTFALLVAILLASIILIARQVPIALTSGFTPALILEPLGAVALLSGVYLALYLCSRGRWVGDGDWLLGLALGLALATPWLSLLNLCLANLLACVVMIPILLYSRSRQSSKQPIATTRVPLGPFLITAFIIVYTFANFFTNLLQL